ncbi:MAG TPA: hypothetical protein VH092_22025 [Urbifossiella sp.]|jgi:anti-sigma regulatory factor (Ser/Thr protein kinase)|nr:hypothetical protein [Urbifossiella sp.]
MTGDHPVGGCGVEYEFASDLMEVRLLQDRLEAALRDAGYDAADQFAFKLAVEEALLDAVMSRNGMGPDERVRVWYVITPDRLAFRILVPR